LNLGVAGINVFRFYLVFLHDLGFDAPKVFEHAICPCIVRTQNMDSRVGSHSFPMSN
jgi:hypothetical protein